MKIIKHFKVLEDDKTGIASLFPLSKKHQLKGFDGVDNLFFLSHDMFEHWFLNSKLHPDRIEHELMATGAAYLIRSVWNSFDYKAYSYQLSHEFQDYCEFQKHENVFGGLKYRKISHDEYDERLDEMIRKGIAENIKVYQSQAWLKTDDFEYVKYWIIKGMKLAEARYGDWL